jgi:outer membrane receptor protein involved in Fe transport
MSIRAQAVRSLLIGAAALAVATPAWAQTVEEAQAQAAAPEDATQGDLIIVTATKRASTVQDVPFSINAQTQEDIQRANANTIEDISRNVAGLTVQNLGPGQSQVSVRGVSAGQIVRDQPGVKEQVGVYLDESVISLSLFTPDLDLFDLNRVETLRGPQGTLFGSGSVGGTIRYITNQPKLGKMEGLVEGNLNYVTDGDIGGHLKGAVNVPLGDTAAVRGVAYYTKYAGFIDAIGPAGGDDVNDGKRYGGRLALLWEPIENLKITPRVVYQKVETDGFNREEFYNLYENQFTSPSNPGGPGKRTQYLKLREKFSDKTWLADLTGSYDFGGVELTSITSYINRDILVSRDASALTGSVTISFAGLEPAVAPAANLPSNLRDTTDLKTWTQELRLASTGDGPLQWLIGGFYSNIDRNYAQRLPTPGYDAQAGDPFLAALCLDVPFGENTCRINNVDPLLRTPFVSSDAAIANGFPLDSPYNADLPYDIKQKAIFGEASYDFGTFKLTAGGRYYDFSETRDFISGGVFSNGDTQIGEKTSSNGFSPRVILTFEPNSNFSVNAQVAKGFRLGGINDPLNLPLCSDADEATFGPFGGAYDDETLWNYEVGFKYQKRNITANAAVFYTDISDLQVNADAGSCSSRLVFNVPKAHTFGIEGEFAISPARGLDLSIAGSYVDAKFDSSVVTADNPATPLVDESGAIIAGIRDGNRLPTVPNFQFATTGTYTWQMNDNADWYVTASWQHVGDRWTQPGDQEPGAGNFGNMIFFDPETPALFGDSADFDWTDKLKLKAYDLVNLSAGIDFDSGLGVSVYVNNLFDENAKLSFDRERGGRARLGYNIGVPRTFGVTVRQKFGN